jgi:hypothetical protein
MARGLLARIDDLRERYDPAAEKRSPRSAHIQGAERRAGQHVNEAGLDQFYEGCGIPLGRSRFGRPTHILPLDYRRSDVSVTFSRSASPMRSERLDLAATACALKPVKGGGLRLVELAKGARLCLFGVLYPSR